MIATAENVQAAAGSLTINGRFLTQSVTGVQRYAHEVVAALDALAGRDPSLRIRILTPRLGGPIPRYRHLTHQVVGRFQGHLWEQLELPRHVGDDVLFCPGNTAPVALLWSGARVVVTVHDLSYLYFPKAYSRSFRLLYNFVMPQVLKFASRILTVSEAERAAIVRHYPLARGRIAAVQNGGLPADSPPVQPAEADEPFVLYVGSLSKRKNFVAMFEVAKVLASKRALKFVFVGGVSESLRESVVAVPDSIRDRLQFLGEVDDWNTLSDYYRRASCFFFPSLYESSGLPPVEAMGCGCPVVAAAIPALEERCGDAAEYCDPRSVGDMVRAIELVIDDSDVSGRLRAAGYARARQFTWQRCAVESLAQIRAASARTRSGADR